LEVDNGYFLPAKDFLDFNFSTGTFGTVHPDFAGDLMLFGLGQITQFNNAAVQFEADYDNLKLSIHVTPDSGSTMLLLLGSLALLAVSRSSLARSQRT
jgi:hypothetical protein